VAAEASSPNAVDGADEMLSFLRRSLWIGTVALAGIAASVGALFLAKEWSTRWALHARDVSRLARDARALATDRETGVRGYLLSGDTTSLAPEVAARAALGRELDSLIALTADNPAQQARARAVRDAVVHWEESYETPTLARAERTRGSTESPSDDLAGKALFDRIRGAIGAFLSTEDALYAERVRLEETFLRAALALVLGEILVLGGVLARLQRRAVSQAVDLGQHQRHLTDQAVELEEQAEALGARGVELEQQTGEALAMARQLEASNRDLAEAIAKSDLAREEARAADERYRLLVEKLPVGVVLQDADGRIETSNPAAERILGLTSDQMLRRSVLDPRWGVVREDGSPFPGDELPAIVSLRTGKPQSNVLMGVRRPDDSLAWIEVNAQPLFRPGEGTPYAAVLSFADITARRQLEQQFRQAQKMDAVGQLAGGVAHDFNNMLTAITGYSGLLLDDLETGDRRREDVDEIKKAANRAAVLTRQLLAFSRQQMLQPRVLDLNATIAELQKMLGRLIGDDIDLATQLDPALGSVKADGGQIEQVLMNLVVNARDAMPQGGKITVETANVELDDEYARKHAVTRPGAYVMLAVSDTGVGMDSETQARIFEPFFTTKEPGKGTGLGLSTVYGIVKQSDGHVWVYSELGRGTTFKVYLPRVEEVAENADLSESAAPSRGGTETILLVEDDEAVRGLALRVLRRTGYTVLEATTGVDALRICADAGATIDLVVTDMMMPEMGGRELAQKLAEVHPRAQLLFMSGYTEEAVRKNGFLEPGVAFLEKPFTADGLRDMVRQALDAANLATA